MLVVGLAREGGVVVLAVVAVVAVVVEAVGMVHLGGGGQFVDPPGVEDLGFRFLGYGVLGFRVLEQHLALHATDLSAQGQGCGI